MPGVLITLLGGLVTHIMSNPTVDRTVVDGVFALAKKVFASNANIETFLALAQTAVDDMLAAKAA